MNQISLLSGNIRQQILTLAVPLLLGNILQQLYNTADSLIVGRFLGTNAFTSVGISGSLMNLFIFILDGFCAGITVILGQFYGSGDRKKYREEVFTALLLGMIIALIISGVCTIFLDPILDLIHTPEELVSYAESYLFIILAGLPFTCLYNLFSGVLRSIGDTKAALIFLAAAITMNIALDFLFIGIIGIGTAGAAAATVLSQLFSAVCCFLYLRDNYPGLLFQKEDLGVHTELMSQSLHFGLISALQASSLYIGKLLVQGSVNTLVTPGIAAYTAATRIEGFANSFGDSGGSAISVMVSQNLGAGNHDRVKKSLKWGMLLNWAVGIIVSLLMFIGSDQALRLFLGSSDELALHYGNGYIRLISLFYIFCFTGSAYMGYFKGRGHMLLAFFGTTGHILLRAALSALWIGKMGLSAVAVATGIGWMLCVTYLTINYVRIYLTEKN